MSNLVKGFVGKVGVKKGETKKGKVWKLYSLQIDKVWYSCGFNNDPGVEEGDYVKLSWEADDRDNKVVDLDSLEKCDPPSTGGSSSDSGSGSNQDEKDIYWAKKDVRSRVGYARAAAIDIVRLALDKEILPWPKSTKADAKFDLLLAMVDKTTMHFYNMTEDQIGIIFDEVEDDDDLPTDLSPGDSDDGNGDDLDD